MTKLHIENLTINVGGKPTMPPIGLLAALAAGGEIKNTKAGLFGDKPSEAVLPLPAIGDKWPGTEAIYAGKSLSRDGSKIVDLIFWPDESNKERSFEDNKSWCESVSTDTGSHAATRQQAIVINDNLRHLLSKDHWYWTETKTNSGEYAFVQLFSYGGQYGNGLYGGYRALAVSEIH
jgi:hypothetical protein